MKTYLITILLILSVYSTQAQLNGTYIVGGPNGDFPTVGIALQTLVQQGVSGPVVFKFYPGSYEVNELLPPIAGSTAQNTITLVSQTQNADDVEFYNNVNSLNSAPILLLNGTRYVNIQHISFIQIGVVTGCIRLSNQTGWISINHCRFKSLLNNAAQNTSLLGVAQQAVLVGDFTVCDNYFGKSKASVGIINPNNSGLINKVVFRGNIVDGGGSAFGFINVDTVIVENNDICCDLGNTVVSKYFQVNNNLIIGKKSNSNIPTLSLNGGVKQGSVASNNTVISNSVSALELLNNSDLQFINNTILTRYSKNYVGSIKIEFNTNLNFQNNILINDSSCFLAAIKSNTNSTFDYNVYYTANDTIFNDGFGNVHTSLASWQTSTGYDVHSIFVNPNFSKPNDLHLQANNPLIIGAGTPLALVTKDIDGEIRDATHPDIGADEYSLRPILDSVIWGCAGSTIILDAGAGFSSYQWSTGVKKQTINVDTIGVGLGSATYSVTVGYGGNTSSATTTVKWQNCTGLLQYQKQEIDVKLFPNPTHGIVNIDITDDLRDFEVRVYNSIGVLLTQKHNKRRIDISGNAKGLYFIQILTDESSAMRKLILR